MQHFSELHDLEIINFSECLMIEFLRIKPSNDGTCCVDYEECNVRLFLELNHASVYLLSYQKFVINKNLVSTDFILKSLH